MKQRPLILIAIVAVVLGAAWLLLGADDEPTAPTRAEIEAADTSRVLEASERPRRSSRGGDDLFDDLEQDEPGTLSGWVFDTHGGAIHNARLDLREREGDLTRTIYTDEEGRFEWPRAPAGRWEAVASAYGHDPTAPTPIRHDEEIVLELPPGALVEGRVLFPDGSPATGFTLGVATVDFTHPDPGGVRRRRLPREEISAADGRFALGPLASGTYRLVAVVDGFAPTLSDPVAVAAGEAVDEVVIALERGSTVSGTIRDEATERPIEGARVFIALPGPGGEPPTDFTDPSGRFELRDVPSGRRTLRANADGYLFEVHGGLEIPRDGTARVDLTLAPLGDDGPGQRTNDIGVVLRPGPRAGFLVVSVFDDSPAAEAGLQRGDIIHTVDGTEVMDRTADDVTELLRGEPGSPISLGYYRSGVGHRSAEMTRAHLFLASPARQAQAPAVTPPRGSEP